jgi:ATP-dependent helicase HrpA/adenine-specific DNA-methyltransferase
MAEIERARQLRKQETWAEKLVWSWLRDRRFTGYKFRRQHPIGSHDTEREKFLQSRGIKTLRFWNSHLRRNAQSIRDTIFNELQARAPHPLPEYTRPMKSERKN